ncbi:MAG: glycosyltransferase family 2 protein [Desulfovibrio sp.]|nr:glycosyltransferase family 2 protein [Desulfovibrio sp.]
MQLVPYLFESFVLILLILLCRAGYRLQRDARRENEARERQTIMNWPRAAVIIPVAGTDPRIASSLRSILSQSYPAFYTFLVTERADEPAAFLIRDLKKDFPNLLHVTAGQSALCGQKNHNILMGVEAAKAMRPDCYVFCDSTHKAPDDFLFSLLHPIACGEASITTGYHQVVPEEQGLTALAYAASVLIMRLLQSLSAFTQPWGGALAMRRGFFEELDIASHWRKCVVDDCALIPLLSRHKRRVRLVAGALLDTHCREVRKEWWEAWMERQILFPRFCVPVQWFLLGVMLALFFLPPFLCFEDLCLAVRHASFSLALFPLFWLAALFFLVLFLRRFLPVQVAPLQWLAAFFLALITFLRVYLGTIGAHEIAWHGYVYTVEKGGIVLTKSRR